MCETFLPLHCIALLINIYWIIWGMLWRIFCCYPIISRWKDRNCRFGVKKVFILSFHWYQICRSWTYFGQDIAFCMHPVCKLSGWQHFLYFFFCITFFLFCFCFFGGEWGWCKGFSFLIILYLPFSLHWYQICPSWTSFTEI